MEPVNGKIFMVHIQSGIQEAFSHIIQSNLKQITKTSKSVDRQREERFD